MKNNLKAPFPYFGGKSKIADKVWHALGQPKHYIEPFFGSGAVLLNRPDWNSDMVETINDKDGHICNVWRSIQFAPEETAKVCDWPVNHADLCARRRRLISEQEKLLENLIADEKYFNLELAGYWIWAASCWIGAGLTRPGAVPRMDGQGTGVHGAGQISRGTGQQGINIKNRIPQLTYSQGVNAGKRPNISHEFSADVGVHSGKKKYIYEWFEALSFRFRNVRVVCGDWSQVCGGNWQDNLGAVGIFFDPPYAADREKRIYAVDSSSVANDVRKWCIERGKKSTYRIVLCGYDEHEELADYGWSRERWKNPGGYSNQKKGETRGKKNCMKETIWYSPHCIVQGKLF